MLFVPNWGTVEERLDKVAQSINRSPIIFPFTAIGEAAANNITTALTIYGGFHVSRPWLQQFAPDAQWVVRAAGWLNPTDANGVTVSLAYQKDDTTIVTLGSQTSTGAGYFKAAIGPFDVFNTASVPAGEPIPSINLRAQKLVSGTASLTRWTIWLELRPSQFG